MSILYIVSTPIGNLEDISQRALTVLREARRILAEDTRHTAILLNRFEISTPLVSLHEHNEAGRSAQVLEWLAAGDTLALVSDAGTPLLSDPGERLVGDVVAAGYRVVPVPGASALLAALVGAGLPTQPFTFYGFAERGGQDRKALLERLGEADHTSVLYESPNRLVRLLEDLASLPDGALRRAAVARELTKLHEEFRRGTVAELLEYYREQPSIRGEIVVVLSAAPVRAPGSEEVAAVARSLLAQGLSPSEAARELARRLQLRRNQAYQVVHSVSEASQAE